MNTPALALLLISSAAEPAPTPARTVEAILADYVAALGDPNVIKKHKSLRLKREVTVTGMGVKGTEERFAAAPDKLISTVTIPGIGIIRQGSTGRVRWAEDPINGLRVLKGPEEEQARIDATWNAELQLQKLYKSVKLTPVPADAPKETKLECLELTPALGRPAITCFDTTTHLRVFQKGTQVTPQGEIPYTARLSDWREVQGVKVPHREQMNAGPMATEAIVVEVTLGAKVSPATFAMPKPTAAKAAPAKP